MEATDPHEAFGAAYRFVSTYVLHAQRLLRDCVDEVERHGFQMLRQNGDRLVTTLDTKIDEPQSWLPSYLLAFFAPKAAFQGGSYGAPANRVARVPFLGLTLDTLDEADTDAPGLWIGWIEGHSQEGLLESKLEKDFLWEIDPEKLAGCPAPATDLAQLTWTPSRHSSGRIVTLNRIALRLIRSHEDAMRVIESLLLAAGPLAPPNRVP